MIMVSGGGEQVSDGSESGRQGGKEQLTKIGQN